MILMLLGNERSVDRIGMSEDMGYNKAVMKILVLADIHGNAEALQAVLNDAPAVQDILVLGDTAGYGPRPDQCLDLLDDRQATIIKGNHDAAINDEINYRRKFNRHGVAAIDYQKSVLSEDQKQRIEQLPDGHVTDDYSAYHGSPRKPHWEYIQHSREAKTAIEDAPTLPVFTGHTHTPAVFAGNPLTKTTPETNTAYDVAKRALINPGSVGQPRDRNPSSSYALFDTDERTIRFYRTNYNIDVVADRIEDAGYDPALARRLYEGR